VIADALAIAFLIIGCFFLLVVTIGIFRLPDAFSRLHLTSKSDPIGTLSILLAVGIYGGWSSDILRIAAIAFLLVITSVTSSHAVGRSVLKMRENGPTQDSTPETEDNHD